MLGGFVMRLYRFLALFQVLCKVISLHRNNILVPSRAFTEPTILAVRAILYAIATLTALLSCKSTDPDIPLDRTHNFTKIIAMEQPFLSLHSEDGPQKVPVADKPVTIGRHPDNLLVITDTQASRFHCVIGKSKDGYVVKDLDSRNGTRLNGQPIKAAKLNEGDVVSIGTTDIKFSSGNSARAQRAAQQPAARAGAGAKPPQPPASRKTPQPAFTPNPDDPPELNPADFMQPGSAQYN